MSDSKNGAKISLIQMVSQKIKCDKDKVAYAMRVAEMAEWLLRRLVLRNAK